MKDIFTFGLVLIALQLNLVAQPEHRIKEKGFYVAPFGLVELSISHSNADLGLFGFFQDFDEFFSYGIDAGYYEGATSYGVSISVGEELDEDDGEELSQGHTNLDSFFGLNGIYRSRIIGTKTKNNFRFHFGGVAGFNYRFYRGEEGLGDEYNETTGRYEYPTKDISIHSGNINMGLYLEIGIRTKNNRSIILNYQPVSVFTGLQRYGLEAGRGTLIFQF